MKHRLALAFITCWPGRIKPAVSAAVTSQIDLLASFAALARQPVPADSATDSHNALDVLLGNSPKNREILIEQGVNGLALRQGDWKFIAPGKGAPMTKSMRSDSSPKAQLYDLSKDPGETTNLAAEKPDKLKELSAVFETIKP